MKPALLSKLTVSISQKQAKDGGGWQVSAHLENYRVAGSSETSHTLYEILSPEDEKIFGERFRKSRIQASDVMRLEHTRWIDCVRVGLYFPTEQLEEAKRMLRQAIAEETEARLAFATGMQKCWQDFVANAPKPTKIHARTRTRQ